MAEPEDYEARMELQLKKLSPGVYLILVHLAFDDEQMNAVTAEHDTYNNPWRKADFDFFTN
ncbi:hypothetical protein AAGF08_00985 [Algoriphagus sp. SE2]|uniref:hypothetical protein n=1 Tax=Algoriphagus sp. SE2 TaxID=3141536 RepID=UPI0031CD5263